MLLAEKALAIRGSIKAVFETERSNGLEAILVMQLELVARYAEL